MGKKLAIFDVDGTLTCTYEVDRVCFVAAFEREFGFTDVHADWERYRQTTDSGITREIFTERLGRPPTAEEVARVQNRLVALLKAAWALDPRGAAEVGGAGAMLKRLRLDSDWRAAVATGCWRITAEHKLAAARISTEGIPLLCSDEMIDRIDILRAAIAEARSRCGEDRFDKLVYVGDGVWDITAARRLEIAFLGIGVGDRAEVLRRAGAGRVLRDFVDLDLFLRALDEADPPQRGSGGRIGE